MNATKSTIPPVQLPTHSQPRVWFITAISSPVGIALARHVLSHGDSLVAGIEKLEMWHKDDDRGEECRRLWDDVEREGWKHRCRIVGFDGRIMSLCQVAVAEAVAVFGRVDILLCCASEAVVGTVEELATSPRTLALIRDQFETNYFGPVNIIKAILPVMRNSGTGHIIVLSSIAGHIAIPGLGMYCASTRALEGFCDSLAYEIAPFNIKTTIIQPNIEVNILTNKITFAPPLPQLSPENTPTPLFRSTLNTILNHLDPANENPHPPSTTIPPPTSTNLNPSSTKEPVSLHANLPQTMKSALVAETIHAILAIGGHENPPARHIVGSEAVMSVKEKLKTVSEEIEDFVEVSCAVDIDDDDDDDDDDDGDGDMGLLD